MSVTRSAEPMTSSSEKGEKALVASDSLASRMKWTQWIREQARVTISGADRVLQRLGSCRARQQESRPAWRSRLSGICSWIKCHDRAYGGGSAL